MPIYGLVRQHLRGVRETATRAAMLGSVDVSAEVARLTIAAVVQAREFPPSEARKFLAELREQIVAYGMVQQDADSTESAIFRELGERLAEAATRFEA